MKSYLIAFGAAFVLCALASAATTACSADPCGCPPSPEHPEPQTLAITGASSYDEAGNDAPLPVQPAGGSLEIAEKAVTLHYVEDGIEHQVRYDVTGPR